MIRFVVGPEGDVVPDVAERLPGRGLWVAARRVAVERAADGRLFAKAAKAQVRVPADLADRVADLLRRRCLDTLGLARRAGIAVCGADKVREALATDARGLLVEAADGSAAERDKFRRLAGSRPVIEVFSRQELAGALGRADAVHVAIGGGGLAETLLRDSTRYAGMQAATMAA
jgi:predicted RNA-binding protein YlxR (DUF448 family)